MSNHKSDLKMTSEHNNLETMLETLNNFAKASLQTSGMLPHKLHIIICNIQT